MLQILIVDDEPFFLDFLSNYIDWKEYGAEVVGTAINGLAAKELLRVKPVDVVITDIRMPIMDGLELICDSGAKYGNLQFIVLSSYSDFHMVEEAFKMGACDYLLKSEITREQLAKVLAGCTEKKQRALDDERLRLAQMEVFQNLSMEVNRLEAMISNNHLLIAKTVYNSFIDRGVDTLQLLHEARQNHLDLTSSPKALLLVKICNYDKTAKNVWKNDHAIFEFALTNILSEVAGTQAGSHVFCRQESEFIVMLTDLPICDEFFQNQYADITAALKKYLTLDVIISTSSFRDENASMLDLYSQAKEASLKSFIFGADRLLVYDDLPQTQNEENIDKAGLVELSLQFSDRLRITSIQEMRKNIDIFKIPINNYDTYQIEKIRETFADYCKSISNYVIRKGYYERVKKEIDYFFDMLYADGVLSKMNEWLENIFTLLAQMEYNTFNIVQRTKNIVHERYGEKISLKSIASEIAVNPSYLSRLFSSSTGEGLMQYINKVRIEASLELLKNSDKRLYEISEIVGYKNVEHYSRTFKKIMGKPPREYTGIPRNSP